MSWNPKKRYKPIYFKIMRLDAMGFTMVEIANETGYSISTVCKILSTDEAKSIGERIKEKTLDTCLDIQTDFQAMAPLVAEEKLRLALHAQDERVRNIACTDILDRAGHAPRKGLDVSITDVGGAKYHDLSEEDLKQKILVELGLVPAAPTGQGTIH